MKTKHAKSACCGEFVVRFGKRRRQCSRCKKTWRIRQKKRGRKKKRAVTSFCLRYLSNQRPPMRATALIRKKSERLIQLQLSRSRDLFLRQSAWAKCPKGGVLIAIVDALIFKWLGKYHTCYLILLRRPKDQMAIITPFWSEPGKETQMGWQHALELLPTVIKQRIRAVVCDGHRGPINYARRKGWLIQRCHFHLLSAILGRRSKSRFGRHSSEGNRIYVLVKKCLETADEDLAMDLLYEIEAEALSTSSRQLRKILRGFVHYYEDYRMYLYHPELGLPGTTNAVESLNACIKSLQNRMKGFATISSFKKWLEALLKFKQKVICNRKNQPN